MIAVLLNEPSRAGIVKLTRGIRVLAAPSIAWEVGNALVALVPRPTQTSAMAEHHDIRLDALRLVENLPTGASWDDLMYEIYVRQAIERGLADADAGLTVDHETAMARIRARIRRAS